MKLGTGALQASRNACRQSSFCENERWESTVKLPPDWSEFISLLFAHRVRFLIVGAHALAANGRPRATQDLGIWVEPTSENAERIGAALVAFGFPALDAATAEFAQLNRMATLGRPPLRIDVMTSIDGVAFADAWAERLDARFGEQTVAFLGKRLLIENKLATGRAKDRLDVRIAPRRRRRLIGGEVEVAGTDDAVMLGNPRSSAACAFAFRGCARAALPPSPQRQRVAGLLHGQQPMLPRRARLPGEHEETSRLERLFERWCRRFGVHAAKLQACGRAERERHDGRREDRVIDVPADGTARRIAERGAQREIRGVETRERELSAETRARCFDRSVAENGELARQRRSRNQPPPLREVARAERHRLTPRDLPSKRDFVPVARRRKPRQKSAFFRGRDELWHVQEPRRRGDGAKAAKSAHSKAWKKRGAGATRGASVEPPGVARCAQLRALRTSGLRANARFRPQGRSRTE